MLDCAGTSVCDLPMASVCHFLLRHGTHHGLAIDLERYLGIQLTMESNRLDKPSR
jgi:hypothetical protein